MYSVEHAKEKQREATRRWREKNKEQDVARAAERYLEQKEADPEFLIKRAERTRQWRASNPERTKKIGQLSDAKRYNASKEEAFKVLGSKCARCDYNNFQVLQIDHIIAIGDAERRKQNHRGRHLYELVVREPEKYQLLCPTHNWEKRVENKEQNKGIRRRPKSAIVVEIENSLVTV